jgi:hypothetical protein
MSRSASAPIPREEEDKDFGWEYAINWNLPWGPRRPESLVRRRRWTRARRATHAVAELRERFVIIDVSMEGPTMLVMLTDGELRPPPYRFDNKSSVQLMVQQKGAPHSRRVLPCSSTLDFAWHAPAGKRVLEVTVEGKRSKSAVAEVNLDRVVEQAQRLRHDQGQLWLHVSLRGDTRTLCITEIEPTDKVTGRAEGEKVKYHLTAALEGIGISLVRSGIGELSYIRLSGIVLTLSASEEKLGAKLCVGDFQVDNQTRDAQLPKVIIRTALLRSRNKDTAAATTPRAQDASAAATPRPTTPRPTAAATDADGGSASGVQPFLRAHLEVSAGPSVGSAKVFPLARLVLDEIDVQLEEAFISSLVQFGAQLRFEDTHAQQSGAPDSAPDERELEQPTAQRRLSPTNLAGTGGVAGASVGAPPQAGAPAEAAEKAVATKWYFHRLSIFPIRVNVTYHTGHHLLTEVQDGAAATANVLMQNIERMPIVLKGVELIHHFDMPQRIGQRIVHAYRQSLLRQVYKIILHIDVLGNPLALARGLAGTIAPGVKDFFALPAEGLMTGDAKLFMRGLSKGTWSLTRSMGEGFFMIPAHLASSLGRVSATFSFDEQYMRDREMASAHHAAPKHIADGLWSGTGLFAKGLVGGVMGVVTAPIQGARKEGAFGLVKGVGRGSAGLFVKPLTGALDLISRTMEGGANTLDWLNDHLEGAEAEVPDELANEGDQRMRPPRMMHGPERATRTYSRHEAIAQRVLQRLHDGFYSTEALQCVVASPNMTEVLVLTDQRLLIASSTSYRTSEHLPLALCQEVRTRADGCTVELYLRSNRLLRSNDMVKNAKRSAARWYASSRAPNTTRPPESSRPQDESSSSMPSSMPPQSSSSMLPESSSSSMPARSMSKLRLSALSAPADISQISQSAETGTTRRSAQSADESSIAWRANAKGQLAGVARGQLAPTCTVHVIICPNVETCRHLVSALILSLTPAAPGTAPWAGEPSAMPKLPDDADALRSYPSRRSSVLSLHTFEVAEGSGFARTSVAGRADLDKGCGVVGFLDTTDEYIGAPAPAAASCLGGRGRASSFASGVGLGEGASGPTGMGNLGLSLGPPRVPRVRLSELATISSEHERERISHHESGDGDEARPSRMSGIMNDRTGFEFALRGSETLELNRTPRDMMTPRPTHPSPLADAKPRGGLISRALRLGRTQKRPLPTALSRASSQLVGQREMSSADCYD